MRVSTPGCTLRRHWTLGGGGGSCGTGSGSQRTVDASATTPPP